MPATMQGPAIFLAQFAGDAAPFNSWGAITKWAGGLGYTGVQIPTWDTRLFDLAKAAGSKVYCDEIKGVAAANGVAITELSTHLQGQLVAVNPAYDHLFDAFDASGVDVGFEIHPGEDVCDGVTFEMFLEIGRAHV